MGRKKRFKVYADVAGTYRFNVESESLEEAWNLAKEEAYRMEEQNGMVYQVTYVEEEK